MRYGRRVGLVGYGPDRGPADAGGFRRLVALALRRTAVLLGQIRRGPNIPAPRIIGEVLNDAPPNDLVAPIHNRMPVILPRDAWRRWLGEDKADIEEMLDVLQPYPPNLMRAYPIGQRVGSVRNNDPALLDPMVLAA